MGRAMAFFAPPHGALGTGQKVKYHKFQRFFIPYFVCVFTNERYKTNQTNFHSVAWVMSKGLDLGLLWGQQINSICLSVMLSPAKPLDEIQPNLVCKLPI